jgi:hypothetical protein
MKPRLIHRHHSESTYAYGEWTITIRRRSKGCYPHKIRTWSEVCVTHARFPGSDWGFNSLKGAVEAIDKGKTMVRVTA